MDRFPAITPEFIQRLDVPGPRYTSYPTVPEWSDSFSADDHRRALLQAGASTRPLSLYVHIPFCREMCTYCGCNVVVTRDHDKADRYLDTVAAETTVAAELLGARRAVSRLHLGGGTPTFLDGAQLERLWRRLTDQFQIAPGAEVAVEIDPVVTTLEQLTLLRSFGFNRLSMGVQDFDPKVQESVNRIQSVETTRAMVEHARAVGFSSVNFDLIYGLPHQSPESFRETMDRVVDLRPDRIAAFSFAYVPEVRPHQRLLEATALPTGAAKLDLFRVAYDRLLERGYRSIGMDHFALPEDELAVAQSERRLWRDFQGYTTRRDTDTVALGVTGISDFGFAYAQNVRLLGVHRDAVANRRPPTWKGMWLSDDDRRRRQVITELMCNFYLDLASFGGDFENELARLADPAYADLLTLDGTKLTLTAIGRVFVRNVAMVFDAYLEAARATGKHSFSRTV